MNALQTNTPRHLWVVGVLALLWNSGGVFDFIMTNTHNEEYMSQFTAEQIEYFYSFPGWFTVAWAIAVFGAVTGAILLLLRKALAEKVFLISLIGLAITTVYSFGFSNGMEVIGDTFNLVFSAVIVVISVALYVYARKQAANGVLR